MSEGRFSEEEVLAPARRAYRPRARLQGRVGSDVTSTDDPDLQEAALVVLRKGFARVMTADEIQATL